MWAGGCDDNRADTVDDRNDDDRESAEGNNRNDPGESHAQRGLRTGEAETENRNLDKKNAGTPCGGAYNIYIDNAYGKSTTLSIILFMVGTYVSL